MCRCLEKEVVSKCGCKMLKKKIWEDRWNLLASKLGGRRREGIRVGRNQEGETYFVYLLISQRGSCFETSFDQYLNYRDTFTVTLGDVMRLLALNRVKSELPLQPNDDWSLKGRYEAKFSLRGVERGRRDNK